MGKVYTFIHKDHTNTKAKSAKEYNLKYIAIYPSDYENFIAAIKENTL